MSEKTISQKITFKGDFLTVLKDEVQLPNGNFATREYIHHIGASAIIAQNNKNEFLLLKQYRHALKTNFYEFPAGKRDFPDEDYLLTAQRELLEETGYRAKLWNKLGLIHPCIGYADEVIHIYHAEQLEFHATSREEGEHIEVFWKTKKEIDDLIRSNNMTDTKSISAWSIYSLNNCS